MALSGRAAAAPLVIAAGVVLALHPGAGGSWATLLGGADQEVAAHLWGLHAASAAGPGWPLGVLHIAEAGAPEGVNLVLPDALNLLFYAPAAALGGPVAGWTAVAAGGLAAAGAAAGLLAARLGGRAWLGAGLALAGGPLLGLLGDGQSEAWPYGVGLAGLVLVGARRRLHRGVGGLLVGLGALGGPYHVVFLGALALLALLTRAGRQSARRAGLAPWLLAAALAGPTLGAALHARPEGLPGTATRAAAPASAADAGHWRGGLRDGVDLADLLLPGPIGPAGPQVSHAGEIPSLILATAVVAARRRRGAARWLAGAGALLALSLGPEVRWAGHPVGAGPAAAATAVFPPLERLTRWYRAAPVAHAVAAAVASTVPRTPVGRVLLLGGAALSAAGSRARPWPVPRSPLPAGPWAGLADARGFVELPPSTAGAPAPGGWRDRTLLDQVLHGRPTAAAGMGLPRGPAAVRAAGDAEGVLRGAAFPPGRAAAWASAGFTHLLVRTHARALPAAARHQLERCFGPAVAAEGGVEAYAVPRSGCDAAPKAHPASAGRPPGAGRD